ncbi:hypothetical protein [Dishui Lake phycodnavirus 4]|nr:hypothetical protein [Dishui Lake phycodnavirus 4]
MGVFKDCGCGCDGRKQEQKFMASLLGALIFFVVASPEAFRLMRSIVGSWVATPNGTPSSAGLALHALVFLLIIWFTMNIKAEYMEGEEASGEEEEEEEEKDAEKPAAKEPAPAAKEPAPAVKEPAPAMKEPAPAMKEPAPEPTKEVKPMVADPAAEQSLEAFSMDTLSMSPSSLTMSSPEGEMIDSCTLKSGKQLVIRNN